MNAFAEDRDSISEADDPWMGFLCFLFVLREMILYADLTELFVCQICGRLHLHLIRTCILLISYGGICYCLRIVSNFIIELGKNAGLSSFRFKA